MCVYVVGGLKKHFVLHFEKAVISFLLEVKLK